MENEKRTVDSIENQRFFLITVYYENYLKNDVKLEKIFLIDVAVSAVVIAALTTFDFDKMHIIL